MDKILLFIPAYNCENQITRVLGQLDNNVMKYIDSVIVVNNRSTDSTEEKVLSFAKKNPELNIKLLRNKENYGLGGSHKVAFNYACDNGFDYVIVLHGDDQGNINDFMKVLRTGYYKKYDCILGARFMRGSKLQGYSAFRTFGNIVYNFLFAIVLQTRVFDLGSGLNMYSTKMLQSRFFTKYPDNLMFNYVMMFGTHYYKHTFKYVPISWREDDQVSNVKMTSQAIKVLKMLKAYLEERETVNGEYRDKIIEAYEADVINEQESLN